MQERAYKLMKEWCDTLLSYQVRTQTPYTDGALLCPACHLLHGRVADLCFPFTVIWAKTKDNRYLEEADRLITWSEYNLLTHDGMWYNDIGSRWFATSAFSCMAIGEAIYNFGDILPRDLKERWMSIFVRMVDSIMTLDTRRDFHPVINYYCAIATTLAMAWRLLGDKKYYDKSKYWLSVVMSHFDDDGLLFGEGYPENSENGSHTVDMGYNLEESLPLLIRYSELTGEYTGFFREKLRAHLEFLLPDGGIDNSWGTRHNKWTYWGSRTSDGVIEGLASVLDEPLFATACERVLTLYEECTHDGLLAMPMAHETGEPTCLHHTFTHAKALASLVCAKVPENTVAAKLYCEEKRGVKKYQNSNLITVSHGEWRATFSTCNVGINSPDTDNFGGSMTLLYHDKYGVVCAATSAHYSPTEPTNQQYLRKADISPCMTAQFTVNGKMACHDKSVTLASNGTTVTAKAEEWAAEYEFYDTELCISLNCKDGVYNLPIVCSKQQNVTVSDDKKQIEIDSKLKIISDVPVNINPNKRILHQVGGFFYLPIYIPVKGNVKIVISE